MSVTPPTIAPDRPAKPRHNPLMHPEVHSQIELNSTQVTPAVAKALSLAFVLSIVAVPVLDVISQQRSAAGVKATELFQPVAAAAGAVGRGDFGKAVDALSPLAQPQFLRAFEDGLGDESAARKFFQPRVQRLLTGVLGFGNDKGVVGLNGWLYYQPGIDYLTGPGIIDAAHLRLRAQKMANKGEKDPHPDPRPAIMRFHEDCRRAGVHLVVVPLPDKAQLQPAQLTRRMALDHPIAPPHNRDWSKFVAELRGAGVDVFDATPPQVRRDDVRYLVQDTHWTPPFMRQVAQSLADHVRARLGPPPRAVQTRLASMKVARLGDVVGMLKLGADQRIFTPQEVTIEQVQDAATGRPWESDPAADVLLLGDSFTNVFSDGEGTEGLGWGRSAGFAPHLSHQLGRPIDVIARNGSGATVTRAELARRADPLGGKRLIIWEFAVRDLACENWKVIPMHAKATPAPVVSAGEIVMQAELLTPVPAEARRTEVYVSALVVLKFRVKKVEAGAYDTAEVLIKVPSILNRQVQPAADLRTGQVYRLTLSAQTPREHAHTQTIDRTDEFDLSPLWCVRFERP